MKPFIVIAIASIFLISCNKNSDSGSSSDPVFGKWSSTLGTSGNTTTGLFGELKDDGTIYFAYYKATQTSDTSVVGYLRVSKGTYKRDGDTFDITYTYETCNPIRAEKMKIKTDSANRDLLIVATQSTVASYKRVSESNGSSSGVTTTLMEDTGCNKF